MMKILLLLFELTCLLAMMALVQQLLMLTSPSRQKPLSTASTSPGALPEL